MRERKVRIVSCLLMCFALLAASTFVEFAAATTSDFIGDVDQFVQEVQSSADDCWRNPSSSRKDTIVSKLNVLRGFVEEGFFDEAYDSPGAIKETKRSIVEITPQPDSLAAIEMSAGGYALGRLLRWGFSTIVGMAILLIALKHPYIGRRLLIMAPTLLIVSVVTFIIIHLPPGDYVTSRIMQLSRLRYRPLGR